MSPPDEPSPAAARSDQHRRSLRRLGRDTLLYGVAAVLAKAVSFLMLPVYTRYLTPADYGLLSILELSQEIAMILFSAGATAGLMRFYFKAQDATERDGVLFTGWVTVTLLYACGTLGLVAASPLIWRFALSGAGTLGMVHLAAANFMLGSLMLVPMQMLVIDQRPMATSVILTAKLVVQLSLNIFFVVLLHAGPMGILWSTFISSLVFGIVMTAILLKRTGVVWSWPAFKNLRRFSLPIQIAVAGSFFLTYGDRFFLEKSHGLASVGVYGIAYQFGFLISGMLGNSFLQAWTPQRFQLAHEDRKTRDDSCNRGLLYGNLVIVTGAVGICLLIRPTILVMTTSAFHSAANMVPVIVLAYLFQVWANVAEFGIEVSEQTRLISLAIWTSVAVVAALYVLLIPPFGGMGAAVATLAAMVVRFAVMLALAQRVWPVSYSWGPHIRMVVGGAVLTAAAFLVPVDGLVPLVALGAVCLVLYAGWLWLGVLHREERRVLWALVRSPRSFRSIFAAGA